MPALPSRPAPIRIARKLSVGVACAAVLLGLCEGASRLLGRAPQRPLPLIANRELGYAEYKAYDHWLFWRMLPHRNVGLVQTNNLGLRGPDVPPDDGSEFRVLSLGESTTFGTRVQYEETYSALLDQSLASCTPRVRVINAGVGGYSLVQGYTYLKRHGLAVGTDAVLLYFGHNDYLPVSYVHNRDSAAAGSSQVLDDWTLLQERSRMPSRLNAWLFLHSNLYRWASSKLQRLPDEQTRRALSSEAEATYRVPEPTRREVLELCLEFCRAHDIQLVVLVPWYRDFVAHIPLLRDFCAAHDVPIVDLPRRLASIGPRIGNFFGDPVHPQPNGHRLIAREIEEVVRPLWCPDGLTDPR